MPNRLFYTVKLSSSLLKDNHYKLSLTFEECLRANLIISLSDSQMLKSIRDITSHEVDLDHLETLYQERNRLKSSKSQSQQKRNRIHALQSEIYKMMYIPEYITVVIDTPSDYHYMFEHGFTFNGHTYLRGSCSASQARVSTIVFVDSAILPSLQSRLNNNRDLSHPLAPSKFNAYYGLYSSASRFVTKPRFCIVPDYSSTIPVDVSWSIENPDWNKDDTIEPRTLDTEFNRFDGSGLISPQMASQWAQDIGESYIPSQFCIRTSFTKGLVNVFDFCLWCQDENNSNYTITDIYGQQRDLREIDVILTEGMAKLWDSWSSQQAFESSCIENGIDWRVTKYAPQFDKEAGLLNYQYLQTLQDTVDIPAICADTVSYIQGVTTDDIYYTLLFCLGQSMDQTSIQNYMESSDNYWLKSLILNHNLFSDKYTKEKIRDMIVARIEQACLGRLLVRGNYQAIVPDSYAFMEYITGKPVQGLLRDGEFYSQFWEKRNVSTIACARSPMTYRSEWVIAHNKTDDPRIQKYFSYSYSGIITNVHGQYTMNFAGSDFDFDIMFTCDTPEIINNTYINERVTAYDVPKPKKKPYLTDEDLYLSDTFSFGQQIGPLTNISTAIYSLLPLFPTDSPEHAKLIERLKQCCVNQSKQIDKTKIGQAVKCIPKVWNTYQPVDPEDDEATTAEKEFNNRILADKKPYFFKYKYKELGKEIREYETMWEKRSVRYFGKSLLSLLSQELFNEKEQTFVDSYHKHYPAIDTECIMNKICHYIEQIKFNPKQKVKPPSASDFNYKTLLSDNFQMNQEVYSEITKEIASTFTAWDQKIKSSRKKQVEKSLDSINTPKLDKTFEYTKLYERLLVICPNEEALANYLVYLFYVDKPSYQKSTLWGVAGKQIFENIKSKTTSYYYPIKDQNGSLSFLYENYQINKIDLPTIMEEEEQQEDDRYL